MDPIDRAIQICGSQAKLAELAGVSQPAIAKARKAGRTSPDLAVAISRATHGQVLIADLVPTVFQAVAAEIARTTDTGAAA